MDIKVTDKDVESGSTRSRSSTSAAIRRSTRSSSRRRASRTPRFAPTSALSSSSSGSTTQVTKNVKVTDTDVQTYYDKNKEQYGTPEQRDVRHILVKTKAEADRIYNSSRPAPTSPALAKKTRSDPARRTTAAS